MAQCALSEPEQAEESIPQGPCQGMSEHEQGRRISIQRGGLAIQSQIQVDKEGIHSGGAAGQGEPELEWNEKCVQTHGWPGLKHEWGEESDPQRYKAVRGQEGEEHVQAQGHPRVQCGSLGRYEEFGQMGLGQACSA